MKVLIIPKLIKVYPLFPRKEVDATDADYSKMIQICLIIRLIIHVQVFRLLLEYSFAFKRTPQKR